MSIVCNECERVIEYTTYDEHVDSGEHEFNKFESTLPNGWIRIVTHSYVGSTATGMTHEDLDFSKDPDDTAGGLIRIITSSKIPHKYLSLLKERGISRLIMAAIWTPPWVLEGLRTWRATGGYCDMTLTEFLEHLDDGQTIV